jgi:tryptophan-rich sensory protein
MLWEVFIVALIPLIVGIIVIVSTNRPGNKEWYKYLISPSWWLLNFWMFMLVWLIVYAIIGASLALVFNDLFVVNDLRLHACLFFAITFVLSFFWIFFFFSIRRPDVALVSIVLSICVGIYTDILLFWVSLASGILFLTLLVWEVFVIIYNAQIIQLNLDCCRPCY